MTVKMMKELLADCPVKAGIYLDGRDGRPLTGVNRIENGRILLSSCQKGTGAALTMEQFLTVLNQQEHTDRVFVSFETDNGGFMEEVLFVCKPLDESRIWLESESDNDMEEELNSMFSYFTDEGLDETNAYDEMLEAGINVKMVRRYLGDEQAEHMEEYCMEHGLLDDEVIEETSKVFKVRLEHAVELFVRAGSEEEVQEWINCHTPEEVKALAAREGKYIEENYKEAILCECMGNSVEDIIIT